MKNFAKYIIATVMGCGALAGTTSCSEDNLDIVQRGVSGLDTYTTADDATVESMIAAVYARFHGDYSLTSSSFGGSSIASSYPNIMYQLTRMSDEDTDGYLYNDSSEGNIYSSTWSFFYTICYWCNMMIERLPNNNVASEAVKSRVIAEARGMRAISMMYLVQFYGNPPLADHVLNGSEGNTPAADSWAFIESELEAAAAVLPSKGGMDGQAQIGGRLSREACYAYEGRAQLWQKKYNEAASTLGNKVIGTGYYKLLDDFDQLNLSSSDFGSENVFEYNFDNGDAFTSSQDSYMDIYAFGSNSVMFYGVGKFPMLFMNWGNGSNPTEGLYNFFVAHDGAEGPRTTGCVMTASDPQVSAMSALSGSLPLTNNMGYFRVRNICRTEDKVGSFPTEFNKKNRVYMRYAEVLLNYAEAVCNGGSNAGSVSGLEALNLVRRRAGLEDAPALDMNNESYGIKAERRAEFYNEGNRYIDVVRWGDAGTVFANVGKTTYFFTGEGQPGAYVTTTATSGGQGWKAGKNELFPIPSTDINNNKDLVQNPGW